MRMSRHAAQSSHLLRNAEDAAATECLLTRKAVMAACSTECMCLLMPNLGPACTLQLDLCEEHVYIANLTRTDHVCEEHSYTCKSYQDRPSVSGEAAHAMYENAPYIIVVQVVCRSASSRPSATYQVDQHTSPSP